MVAAIGGTLTPVVLGNYASDLTVWAGHHKLCGRFGASALPKVMRPFGYLKQHQTQSIFPSRTSLAYCSNMRAACSRAFLFMLTRCSCGNGGWTLPQLVLFVATNATCHGVTRMQSHRTGSDSPACISTRFAPLCWHTQNSTSYLTRHQPCIAGLRPQHDSMSAFHAAPLFRHTICRGVRARRSAQDAPEIHRTDNPFGNKNGGRTHLTARTAGEKSAQSRTYRPGVQTHSLG